MENIELRKKIGINIRKHRKNKKLTQGGLGKIVGVEHNTISAYERGASSIDQDMLFKLSDALGVKIDDFFPARKHDTDDFERALKMADGLDLEDMEFLNQLIEKALSMNEEEREKFLERIRFTVEYHNKHK